jgi:methionine-rich copper-binding protein CopC
MSSRFLIALSAALLVPTFGAKAGEAWAHAYPAVTVPGNGAILREAPHEVRIQFTEGVELSFSRIEVKGANGDVVSQGKLRKLADDTLAVDLKSLRPGSYTVEWQVLSVDTHVTDGVLRFTVGGAEK